jgi:hypothetical protein
LAGRNSFTVATDDVVPNPFMGMNNIVVTTQIKCDVQPEDAISRCASPEPDQGSISSFVSTRFLSKTSRTNDTAIESQSASIPSRASRIHVEDIEAQRTLRNNTTGRNGYRATVVATSPAANISVVPTTLSTTHPAVKRTAEGHAAAMAYFQVAFLMFLALFVVWLPSSINRMYQFMHKDRPSFALNIVSAVVLPLQGAWNAIIYIFTTRAECKRAWGMIMSKLTGSPLPHQPPRHTYRKETMMSSRDTRESDADISLDDIFGQGVHVRRSEVPNTDAVEEDKAQRDGESR